MDEGKAIGYNWAAIVIGIIGTIAAATMNGTEKIALITERLQQAFSPTYLEVLDESAAHVGHAGHQGGGRHFAVIISAACFSSVSRVDAHRQIYALFSDLIPNEIHALRIQLIR